MYAIFDYDNNEFIHIDRTSVSQSWGAKPDFEYIDNGGAAYFMAVFDSKKAAKKYIKKKIKIIEHGGIKTKSGFVAIEEHINNLEIKKISF